MTDIAFLQDHHVSLSASLISQLYKTAYYSGDLDTLQLLRSLPRNQLFY